MNLYPHNQQAVNAVLAHYGSGHTKAAVVHATGTGKSYIIASIVEQYDKCLVIAPNDYVLAETQKLCKPGTVFVTYIAAMFDHVTATDYDLIVLDEYHRAGAPEWGAAVSTIIRNNPNARLLGTTATDIRYLDGMRNMSDELFDGNVVSHLSLPEAWVRHILIPPVYVTGLYTFDNIVEECRQRIESNSRITAERKSQAISLLEGYRLDWIKAEGVSEILRKHLRHDTRRVIIFCEHIKHINDVMTQSIQWFANAGFKVFKTYSVNIENRQSDNDLLDFACNDFTGIKVMFSVNMLNEGVHVPDVDAVIMLRPTTSKIIHLQQIGRCMTTNNRKQPIIFDLVDNLTKSSAILDAQREFRQRLNEDRTKEYQHPESESFDFIVEDYVQNTRKVIEMLEKEFLATTFEDRMMEAERWCIANKRYPGVYIRREMTTEQRYEHNLHHFLYIYRDREEVVEFRKKYVTFKYMYFEEKVEEVTKWIEANKRLPHTLCGERKKNNKSEERRQEDHMAQFIYRSRADQRIASLIRQYGETINKYTDEEMQRFVIDFVNEHNALPIKSKKKGREFEKTLGSYIINHSNEPFYKELLERFNYCTEEQRRANRKNELIHFCETHNRLPKENIASEHSLYKFMRGCKRNHSEFIRQLYKKYRPEKKTDEEMFAILKAFCERYGRVPSEKKKVKEEGEMEAFTIYRNKRIRNMAAFQDLHDKYCKRK